MAAETGHLVLGTLHTTSAAKTLERIIDASPTEQKDQVATSLAQSLHGVVSQILVRRADTHSRRAILEVMVMTPAIANLLTLGKIFQIPSLIETGRNRGMQLMDQALLEAVHAKQIDSEDAYQYANDKRKFQQFVTEPLLAL
jgi:twitching motility protein PilT